MTQKTVPMGWMAGLTVVCVAITIGVLPAFLTSAQDKETRYFEETGHNVSGDFLRFYEARGGRAIFGYPLTREFEEDGRQVQYFQRARMESHPENPEPYKVQLGLLGDELGHRQPPIPATEIPPPGHPDKRYFAETGHTVSFAFLEFYENNGGLDVFGYPISEWFVELNGRIVQYFQRGKMEWYPENPPGQRVQLGMLGTIYVEQFVDPIYTEREDPFYRAQTPLPTAEPPQEGQSIPSEVTDLQALVTLKYAIVGLRGTQTAYIYVLDQASQGVEGASAEIEVQYRDGRVSRFSAQETNENGYCQIDFPIEDPAPGYVVIVNLHARYGTWEAGSNTAFLPWW